MYNRNLFAVTILACLGGAGALADDLPDVLARCRNACMHLPARYDFTLEAAMRRVAGHGPRYERIVRATAPD